MRHTNTFSKRSNIRLRVSAVTSLVALSLSCALTACDGDSSDAAPVSQSSSAATTSAAAASTAPSAVSTASAPASADRSDSGSNSNTSSPSASSGSKSTTTTTTTSTVPTKSIQEWTACDGTTDDSVGAAAAFAAASNGGFTLVVDCPVRLHIASDIARPIFIDNNTTVQFSGSGQFIVDNVFQPAFVIAGSQNVTLTDWNVEYVGGLPVNWDVGGYELNGKFVSVSGYAQPAMAFNDYTLVHWLEAHRGMTFAHGIGSWWVGPTNTSAVFFVVGGVSNLNVTGMKLYVPATAGGDRFIPMAFSLSKNYKPNQSVTAATPATAQYMAVPNGVQFENIELDGTYMGWQGNLQNATFTNIQSHRYGDLQDANGANVGGIGKWFAPPHLLYLNYDFTGDPALFNKNITIDDVLDNGPRVGVARDRGGSDTQSGYALSLKIGCVSCSVTNYTTTRPDGFLDLLPSQGLTISSASATYDSAFLNNLYPAWRFPSTLPSTGVTVKNVTLKDTAPQSVQPPISNAAQPGNQQIVLSNVSATVNQWASSSLIVPTIEGQGNNVAVTYNMLTTQTRLAYSEKGAMMLMLQAKPYTISAAQTAVLTWIAESASGCTASGAWAGALQARGSQVYKAGSSGSLDFSLGCQDSGIQATATLPVEVTSN